MDPIRHTVDIITTCAICGEPCTTVDAPDVCCGGVATRRAFHHVGSSGLRSVCVQHLAWVWYGEGPANA